MIAVTGASGFVGRNLLRVMRERGIPVRAVVHSSQGETWARSLGIEGVQADVRDEVSLERAFQGCSVVVHLVAIIRERGPHTFEAINHLGTQAVVSAAHRCGVRKLIHLSALGASPVTPSRYLASKWRGEEAVRRGAVPYTIFRPSLIFGPGGGALAQLLALTRYGPFYPFILRVGESPLLERLADLLPLIPVLGDGTYRSMPIDLRDVIRCVIQAVEREDVVGREFDLGGPEVVTYSSLLDRLLQILRKHRYKVHIPLSLSWFLVRAGERILSNPPITSAEFEALLLDNVCDPAPAYQTFGLTPRPLDETLRWALGLQE